MFTVVVAVIASVTGIFAPVAALRHASVSTSSLSAALPLFAESPVSMISAACSSGQNAEVEQVADPALGYVYADWMGCQGIAFARSLDGGKTWETPIHVPGSIGSNVNAWDPAIAVGPDGTVYAAFMRAKNAQWYPFVAASFDHGASFAYVTGLMPPDPKNWGDRDFLAVAPNGTLYLTYDYGPERTSVTFICAASGSCAFLTGDLNVVIQWSLDHGKTWSRIVPINPDFPAGGGDSAPLWIEPDGRIDVLYQGYHITNTTTYTMDPANTYFTSSTDGGAHWSSPVLVGPGTGTMSLSEWWIDGALGIDSAGNLYATWDTQGATEDIGWLAFSTDHGSTWSAAVRVTPDIGQAAHIMEVAGGSAGTAYLSYLANNSTLGWGLFVRSFTLRTGAMSDPILASSGIWGSPDVWPGDTTGISALSPTEVVLTWGSAITISGQPKSQIFAAVLDFQPG
jgi:BNR/Asp-box repeat